MSILNVNTIKPVGSGQTVTVSADSLTIGVTSITSGSINLGSSGSITIGTAVLSSTNTGIVTSSTSTRVSVASTATGALIFNSTVGALQVYDGTQWLTLTSTVAAQSSFIHLQTHL
jgi:hypothetical protein